MSESVSFNKEIVVLLLRQSSGRASVGLSITITTFLPLEMKYSIALL